MLQDGTIGDEFVIKPLPSSMTLSRRKAEDDLSVTNVFQVNSSSANNQSTDNETIHREQAHFVIKKTIYSNVSLHSDFASLEPATEELDNSTWNLFKSSNKTARRRRSDPVAHTAWPEVLLIVDYDSFLLHNSNNEAVKRYFISFWNGVDLRYKLLSHPHIRVSLIGIIVAKVRQS